MRAGTAALIEMHRDAFDPWRIQAVRHQMADHPLLQPDPLVALGKRFQGSRHLFAFNNNAGADANFDAYMPITCPHMVETGDGPSITINLTYSTNATRRHAMEHVVHDLMRRKGLHPFAIGKHPLHDQLNDVGASAWIAMHGTGSHPPARPSLAHHTAYAMAD